MRTVRIHSDGACQGNPGPGGWAATIESEGQTRQLSGGVPATTNNRMELQGAIEALSALPEPCAIEFHTDSTYLRNGITLWLKGWKRNGWRTQSRQPVKNEDLWRALDLAASRHQITWHWVKGHAGHAGNERCDELATAEISKIRTSHSRERLRQDLRAFQAQNAGERSEQLPLALE